MRSADPLLSFEHVVAGYATDPVIRDVSLSVHGGEVVGLVGPNGSGKTTLVRIGSRALRPWSGRVLVRGVDPYDGRGREAARLLAVVPQDVAPAFSFTVLETVLMGRTPYLSAWGSGNAEDWATARTAMVAASVQHLADRPVDELSGGERQRVVLAQALAQRSPVLVLDEPTTHLDIRHLLDMLSIVRGLAQGEGVAVLAVLHDLNLAAVACDRLAVLDRGEVVAEGPPAEVLTEELIRRVYGVQADVVRDPGSGLPAIRLGSPPAAPKPLGRRAHVVGGAGRGGPLLRRLAAAGYDVSVGVLHGGDSDEAVAERLNLVRVSVPAFSTIDPATAKECRRVMSGADLLVVCDAPFGPGNVENLRLALDAARAGVETVVLEQVPISERDFTGGEATQLWNELRDHARRVAASYEEVAVEAG